MSAMKMKVELNLDQHLDARQMKMEEQERQLKTMQVVLLKFNTKNTQLMPSCVFLVFADAKLGSFF